MQGLIVVTLTFYYISCETFQKITGWLEGKKGVVPDVKVPEKGAETFLTFDTMSGETLSRVTRGIRQCTKEHFP